MLTEESCRADELAAMVRVAVRAILPADINVNHLAEYDFGVVGHLPGPDVFRLVVNETSTPAVVEQSQEPSLSLRPGRC